MDLLIPTEWLREFVETNATNKELAEYLTLCGPTVDRIHGTGDKAVLEVEVTTNRVDAASIYGIAREAAAILPRFGKKAKLHIPSLKKPSAGKELDFKIVSDPKLSPRTMAILLSDVAIGPSPGWLVNRLEAIGQRSLNNVIDVTNYVTMEVGHPIHAFDYDRFDNKTIVVREAKKGEKLVTLDKKTHEMNGGEIVFGDGKGRIVDLPGIMGTDNTVVTRKTKNVLLWIESIDPKKVRKASMDHEIRSMAAILNEKAVDPEIAMPTFLRAIELMKESAGAKVGSKLVDINHTKKRSVTVKTSHEFIESRMGVKITKNEMKKYLKPLGFGVNWSGNRLSVKVPTWRQTDVSIPEDIVEEVARIYGYNSLPNTMLSGGLPQPSTDSPLDFEEKIREMLTGFGGNEVMTLSLVSKDMDDSGLSLKNPLGEDYRYLRTSLMPSMVAAERENSGIKDPFFLYEIANVYLPVKNSLPSERMALGVVFCRYDYRRAKGVVESLLARLGSEVQLIAEDSKGFVPSKRLTIKGKVEIGQFGELESGQMYVELDVERLRANSTGRSTYKPIPKYPAQVEDITVKLPEKTKVGEVINAALSVDKISSFSLGDIYKSAYTFRVEYLDKKKTLANEDVIKIRKKLLGKLSTLGITQT